MQSHRLIFRNFYYFGRNLEYFGFNNLIKIFDELNIHSSPYILIWQVMEYNNENRITINRNLPLLFLKLIS